MPEYSTANKGEGAMKDLIGYIAKALVDNPEEVTVSEIENCAGNEDYFRRRFRQDKKAYGSRDYRIISW